MKRLYKLLACALLCVTCACSNDDIPDNQETELRQEGDETVSCFNLNRTAFNLPESAADVSLRLVSPDNPEDDTAGTPKEAKTKEAKRDTLHLPTKLVMTDNKIRVETRIPKGVTLDKTYLLTLHSERGARRYAGGVKATFKGNRLTGIEAEAPAYRGLEGEGTEESPYLIGSADDFLSFLNNLRRDEMFSGSELCFRQTADFTAPTQSSIVDGRGYYGFTFAGIYDGSGHSIDNLYYVGNKDSEKDSKIGLFPRLIDGAAIRNLSLPNVMISRVYGTVGALCGYASGNVTISNVSTSGTITDCQNQVGGLIGYACGSLNVDGYDMSMNLEGATNVGGAVGEANCNNLVISNMTTESHRFSVSATDSKAGGVAGTIDNDGSLCLSNITLEHTVSAEDADVRIISTPSNGGGLIGFLWSGPSTRMENIKIKCPVYADNGLAGGLAGCCEMESDIGLHKCRVMSTISGGSEIGGFFGSLECWGNYTLGFTGSDGDNCFKVDLAAAGIRASSNGGGLIGTLKRGPAINGPKISISANVSTSGQGAGGVIGYMEESTLDPSLFDLNSSMRVKGDTKVGALVGQSRLGSICDSRNPEFDVERTPKAYIPSKSDFPSQVCCMVEGNNYVGGIVGYSESFLYRLASASTVTAHGSYAGGIAGYAGICDGSPVQRCVFMGTLGCGGPYTGGITGYLANAVEGRTPGGFMRDCVNYSDISGGNYTGGITGIVDYTSCVRMELHWSVNLGNIKGGVSCGGLIGKCDGNGGVGMGMVGLANYGNVNSTGNDNTAGVGGIIGHARSTHIAINGAMNKGDIHAEGHVQGVGGIAGILGHDANGAAVYQDHNGEMYWSANYGKISCSNRESYIGGVCGWLEEGYSGGHDSYIHDCYNIGEVTTDHNSDTGGILGYVDHFGRIERCVNFGHVSYGNATVGTQKPACIFYHSDLNMIEGTGNGWCADKKISTANQGQQSQYRGLSFDNTNWKMTGGRPHLASNRFEDVTPPN